MEEDRGSVSGPREQGHLADSVSSVGPRQAPAHGQLGEARREGTRRSRFAACCYAAARAFIVVTLVACSMPFAWQLLTGGSTLAVTGRSMLPTYDRGDVLFVERVREPSPAFWVRGAVVVVSFDPAKPDEDRYVHRVHRVLGGGEAILKGDANPVEDVSPVDVRQVYGLPVGHLTGVWARFYLFTQSVNGRIVLFAGGIGLLLLLDHLQQKAVRPAAAFDSVVTRPRAHARVSP